MSYLQLEGLGAGVEAIPLQILEAARMATLYPLIQAVYAARETAAKAIEPAAQLIDHGLAGNVQALASAKADLERMMQGIPAGSPGFPTGFPGFIQMADSILGISQPSQADAATQSGATFRQAQADIDWWINRASGALSKANVSASDARTFSGDVSNTFFSWSDALSTNVPKIVEAAKSGAAKLGAAGGDLANAAESLARSAKAGAQQVENLPGYAKMAAVAAAAVGVFALAAIFIATRK